MRLLYRIRLGVLLWLVLWVLWVMLDGLRSGVMGKVLKLRGSCGRRIEVGMCTMIEHGLIGNVGEAILRWLWGSCTLMLHRDKA